jgi:plasmid stabilization system protein ParE
MILELSPRIIHDLDEIVFWIDQDDSSVAEHLVGKLRAKIIRIGKILWLINSGRKSGRTLVSP